MYILKFPYTPLVIFSINPTRNENNTRLEITLPQIIIILNSGDQLNRKGTLTVSTLHFFFYKLDTIVSGFYIMFVGFHVSKVLQGLFNS